MDKTILDKFLGEMLIFLQGARDFALEQLPLVAKEVLRYRLTMAIMYVVLSLAAFGAAWVGHRRMWQWYRKIEMSYDSDSVFLGYLPIAAVVVAFGIVFCINLLEAIQILTAPRVFLIEYVSHLLNPSK